MVGMQLRTVEYGIEMVQYPYKILCENLLLVCLGIEKRGNPSVDDDHVSTKTLL